MNGITVTNVLFIELKVERLKELTYPRPNSLKSHMSTEKKSVSFPEKEDISQSVKKREGVP